MTMNIISTTDSAEDVAKAMAHGKPESKAEKKPASPAEKPEDKKKAASGSAEDINEPDLDADLDDGDEDVENADGKDAGKPKKKGGYQRRIDKITKEREDARREANLWKEQALKGKEKPPEKLEEKVEAKAEVKKDDRPTADKFRTHEEYLEALTDWKFENREKAAKEAAKLEQIKSEQEKSVKTFREKLQEFKKSNTDFDELLKEVGHIESPVLHEIFLTSENGPELMYALMQDPEEFERIAKLPAAAAYREMGKFEAKLPQASATETESKTTKAPKPVSPVKGKASGSTKSLDEMDYQEYKAAREKQISKG